MSSGKKTLLVIATILVIGGGAISFGAFAAAGFNFENLSTESRNWTSSTKTFAPETENPHTAIVLRDMGEDVRIEPTDGDAIEVTYWTNERKSFDVDDNGGTVTVEGSREPAIDIMMIGSFEDHSTVLKVPRSYTGTLDIDLMGGNVDAADLDRLGSVTAKTASGNISLSRLAADDIVTNAASGNVQVQRVQCAYLSATTMSGNIEFSDVEATEIVKLDTASGGQLLRGVNTATLDARMGSGDILAAGVAATDAKFDAVSGSVNASFSGSDGEYAIEVGTSSRDIAGSAVVELDGDGKAQPLTEWSNFMEWRKDPLGSKVLEILRAEGEAGRMPVVPDNDMTRLFLDSMPINSMSVLMGADGKQIFEYMLEKYAELTK